MEGGGVEAVRNTPKWRYVIYEQTLILENVGSLEECLGISKLLLGTFINDVTQIWVFSTPFPSLTLLYLIYSGGLKTEHFWYLDGQMCLEVSLDCFYE